MTGTTPDVQRVTWAPPDADSSELPSWAVPDVELIHPTEDALKRARYLRRHVPKMEGQHRWMTVEHRDPLTGTVVTSMTFCWDCQCKLGWDDPGFCDREADDGWFDERVTAHNRAHHSGHYSSNGLSMRARTRVLRDGANLWCQECDATVQCRYLPDRAAWRCVEHGHVTTAAEAIEHMRGTHGTDKD